MMMDDDDDTIFIIMVKCSTVFFRVVSPSQALVQHPLPESWKFPRVVEPRGPWTTGTQRDIAGATAGQLGPGLFTLQLVNAWLNLKKMGPEGTLKLGNKYKCLKVS